MRMRRAAWCATGLGWLLAVGSCHREGGLPAPPEFSAGQRAVWQLVPEDATGALVIADLGHLLGRLRAAKAVLDTGPQTRALVAEGSARAVAAIGFDPLDDGGWRKAGLDPSGPLALVLGPHAAQVVFRAADPAAASATVQAWRARAEAKDELGCAPAGALHACGTPGWKLALEGKPTLWPHLEANLPAGHRGMELLAYAPLDRGEAQAALEKAPVKGLHAGYFAMTLAPERVIARVGARVDDAARWRGFLEPRRPGALLGLGVGAISAGRVTFSPDKLWTLVSDALKPQAGDGGQAFDPIALAQAGIGLDLRADLVDNLTGEVVFVGYRSPRRTDKEGKPRALADRQAGAMVVGTLDDQRSRRLATRLGELLGGALATFAALGESAGLQVAYRVEPGDRPVHWFSAQLGPELVKAAGFEHLDAFITSVEGGVAIGFGEDGVAELRKRPREKPSTFLSGLPLPEERERFEHGQATFVSRVGDGVGTHRSEEAAGKILEALRPGTGALLLELEQLGQLVFDAIASVDVSADRCELFYQVSFL